MCWEENILGTYVIRKIFDQFRKRLLGDRRLYDVARGQENCISRESYFVTSRVSRESPEQNKHENPLEAGIFKLVDRALNRRVIKNQVAHLK